jgi:hypothetical protein
LLATGACVLLHHCRAKPLEVVTPLMRVHVRALLLALLTPASAPVVPVATAAAALRALLHLSLHCSSCRRCGGSQGGRVLLRAASCTRDPAVQNRVEVACEVRRRQGHAQSCGRQRVSRAWCRMRRIRVHASFSCCRHENGRRN